MKRGHGLFGGNKIYTSLVGGTTEHLQTVTIAPSTV